MNICQDLGKYVSQLKGGLGAGQIRTPGLFASFILFMFFLPIMSHDICEHELNSENKNRG